MGEWKLRRLGDVTHKIGMGPFGSSIKVSTFVDSGVPIISGQHLRSARMSDDPGFNYITMEHALELSSANVYRGDVIFTHAGSIGQVAVIPEWSKFDRYVISQRQFFARCDERVLFPEYLAYYFASRDGRHLLLANTSYSGVPSIAQPVRYLRSLRIPIPSIAEQRAIAEVLGALDDKIAANEAIARTTRDLLAASFAALGIDKQPETSAASIALSELIELNPPVPKPISDTAAYLEMKNLPDDAITSAEWTYREPKGGARFQNGDTLLARITPCLENGKIGFVDFLEESEVGFGSTEFIVMRSRRGTPAALPYFLGISGRFRSFAMRHMVGTSGRQRVSAEDLSVFPVTVPNNGELARFQELSSPLIARVGAAVRESKALASARDELLPLLMSGKIRVRDAEKVVEEVT